MTTLLVGIGIVVAFAIIFWLDRNQGPEPTRSIIHLFDILRNLQWEMNEDDIKKTFPEFATANLTRLKHRTTLSLKEYNEGQEIYTTFSFSNNKENNVNKAEIKLSRINEKEIDLLFSTVCKQYGQPERNNSGIEGSVKWPTEPGMLILENTAPEQYVLTIKEEEIEAPKV